ASFKTSHFGRSLRWAKILILEILHVFLRLKFSSALTLTKLKRFESGSPEYKAVTGKRVCEQQES
ncbi:MAG: hypothetical protein KKA35_14515, partial [Proteobacteria bacterium]|nr:hypothetical protein [Pseudomonadota bacterium]